jgi:hypothetical protein
MVMVVVVVVQQQQAVAAASTEAAGGLHEVAGGKASEYACMGECYQHGACNSSLQCHSIGLASPWGEQYAAAGLQQQTTCRH